MLAEVNHFVFGPVSPVLALLSAGLGCLLGIILATRAQKFTGRRRVRLLLYASISLGVTGIWQAKVVALLGLDVPATILRYDPMLVAASLGVALVASAGGMFIVGYGRPGFWRLLAAGGLFGGAVVGAHALLMRSLQVGGAIRFNPALVLVSVAMAMGVAVAMLWFMLGTRGLRAALSASAGTGLAICAAHYVGEAAIEVNIGTRTAEGVTGLGSMQVALLALVLGTVLTAMMWFFTVGTATRRDLHAIFDPLDDSGQIEPWMIEHVTARIALTTTGEIPVVRDDESDDAPTVRTTYVPGSSPIAAAFSGPLPGRKELGPRPTPGITPVWRTMPVWGRPEVTPEPEQSRGWALRNAVAARLKDRGNPADLAGNSRHGDQPAPTIAPVSPAPDGRDRGESAHKATVLAPELVPAGSEVDDESAAPAAAARPPGYGSPLPRRNSRI
jgi:NO-binding membrane sensor protein with MHYT domain